MNLLRVFDVLPNLPVPTYHSFAPTTKGLAFGFLAKTNDYKIFKCGEYMGTGGVKDYVYVYSLSTDSWKMVKKAKSGADAGHKLSNSAVVNGVAYWVASVYKFRKSEIVIIGFDMENDTIREIMLPSPYFEGNASSVVHVENSIFGELLSLFYYDTLTYILDIWILENAGEPNEAWTKKKSLNFEPSWWPIGFKNNSEIVIRGCREFLSYDLEKKEAKGIVDDDSLNELRWNAEYYSLHRINRFEETLVMLDVNRQV